MDTRETRTVTRSRNSGWRVGFTLEPKAQLLCEMWGVSGEALCEMALTDLLERSLAGFKSFDTFAVAHYIESDPRWREIAADCDDYRDFLSECARRGIHETPRGNIHLKSRSIVRAELGPLIRSIRKPEEEKKRAYQRRKIKA